MDRFESIYQDVEQVEEYRLGGYHPVRLHDVFNKRYEVTGKIAYGSSSTVWQAKDHLHQQLVALKILKADVSKKNNNELSMLLHLSRSTLKHPGKKYVIELLDYFKHVGPNGTHLCLVLPFMVTDGLDIIMSVKPPHPEYVRSVSEQLSLGLDYLHTQGIIHCDLHPANIMFSVAGVVESEITSQLKSPDFCPVRWRKGVQIDDSAPEFLLTPQMPSSELREKAHIAPKVMIGDLGEATWKQKHDKPLVTPIPFRAPELISKTSWDASIDIWALGCLVFYFATNQTLFPVIAWGMTQEEVDKEHFIYINDILNTDALVHKSFVDYVTQRLSSNFSALDIQRLASFILMMLQTNQHKRAPTSELLGHQFLMKNNHTILNQELNGCILE